METAMSSPSPTETEGSTPPPSTPSSSSSSSSSSVVLSALSEGFEFLSRVSQKRDSALYAATGAVSGSGGLAGAGAAGSGVADNPYSCVMVNFIDPTSMMPSLSSLSSSSSSTPMSSPMSSPSLVRPPEATKKRWKGVGGGGGGGGGGDAGGAAGGAFRLYDRLVHIFRRDYSFALRSVPYSNLRTDRRDTIDALPVRCYLSGAGGSGSGPGPGSTPSCSLEVPPATGPVADPSEWHTGPYCHVYIAACRDAEHYRSKVRPALRAFVGQIEGGARSASSGGGGTAVAVAVAMGVGSDAGIASIKSPGGGGGGGGGNSAAGGPSGAAIATSSSDDASSVGGSSGGGAIGGGGGAAAGVGGKGSGKGKSSRGGGGSGAAMTVSGNKIRPSEEERNAAMVAGQAVGGHYSCQYVIVYVPTGSDGDGSGGGGGGGDDGAFAGTSASASTPGGGVGLRARMAGVRSRSDRPGSGAALSSVSSPPPAHVTSSSGAGPGGGGGGGGGGGAPDATSNALTTAATLARESGGGSGGSGDLDDAVVLSSSYGGDGGGGGGGDDASLSDSVAAAAAPPPGPIAHSSKVEKDLHRKFCHDFPNGRTVILSTLLDGGGGVDPAIASTSSSDRDRDRDRDPDPMTSLVPDMDELAAAMSPLKNQEWNALLRALGDAIVAGFRDRVRRYDEELRRLDSKRSATLAASNAASSSATGGVAAMVGTAAGGGGDDAFDLGHFFLVKESLAFTYEQMQLHGEALLQYEELEAFVPESAVIASASSLAPPPPPSLAPSSVPVGGVKEGDDGTQGDGGAQRANKPPSSSSSSYAYPYSASSSVHDWEMASRQDALGFRRQIRKAAAEVASSSSSSSCFSFHYVAQYLLARECRLLFKMRRPVDVLSRSGDFARALYRAKLEEARVALAAAAAAAAGTEKEEVGSGGEERFEQQRESRTMIVAEAEAWALETCWDVMRACESYFGFGGSGNAVVEGGGGGAYPSSSSLDIVGADSAAHHPPDLSAATMMTNMTTAAMMTTTASATPPSSPEDAQDAARTLGELLSFARLRLLRLGDAEFYPSNPVRDAAGVERPRDTLVPWERWEDLAAKAKGGGRTNRWGEADAGPAPASADSAERDAGHGARPKRPLLDPRRPTSPWILSALSSVRSYQDRYLELTSLAVRLHERCGRYRLAARLQGEQAELLLLRGQHADAARTILPIADAFARDRWDGAYYWRLFRLACCQRNAGDAVSYLNTLTRCFNRRLGAVAPARTADLLQRDLEAVVGEPEVSEYRLGISPFLETEFSVEPTLQGKSSHPLGYLRKKIVRHYCCVGEMVRCSLGLVCHLPKKIEIDSIRMFVLTQERYEAVHRSARGLIKEEDAFRVLTAVEPEESSADAGGGGGGGNVVACKGLTIRPGENRIQFAWTPATVGQYVLSTVEIRWKAASFYYDAAALRRPILGIDVLPSEPTQTIELNPLFLIPGHTQTVRLVFHSGSDVVKEGSVELACSDGLKVLPPGVGSLGVDGGGGAGAGGSGGEDRWCERCTVPLEPCGPNSEIVLTTQVKSEAPGRDRHGFVPSAEGAKGWGAGGGEGARFGAPRGGDDDMEDMDEDDPEVDAILYQYGQRRAEHEGRVQTMRAKVVTSYRHALYEGSIKGGTEPKSDPMTTVLEAMVTTLDRPALTVNYAEAHSCGGDMVVVSASLHCNTPVPFFLKEWDVNLPKPLELDLDGDLNENLFGHAVAEGEQLFFAFRCHIVSADLHASFSGSGGENALGPPALSAEERRNGGGRLASPVSVVVPDRPILHVVLQDEFGKTFRQVLHLDLDDFYARLMREGEDEYGGIGAAFAELRCSAEEGVVGAPVRFEVEVDVSTLSLRAGAGVGAGPTVPEEDAVQDPASPLALLDDPSSSSSSPVIQYAISCRETDWILGGKVQGILGQSETKKVPSSSSSPTSLESSSSLSSSSSKKSFTLDFVGIPTRSGLLKRFPEVELRYLPSLLGGGDGTMFSAAEVRGDWAISSSPSFPPILVRLRHPESFKSLSYTHHMALACTASLEI